MHNLKETSLMILDNVQSYQRGLFGNFSQWVGHGFILPFLFLARFL
jgi:hypothetical protein